MSEQQHSGWASSEDEPALTGPFLAEMNPGGVFAQDMPAARPPIRKTRIKGLPGVSGDDEGRDGWKEVT